MLDTLRFDQLNVEDARKLVEHVASRQHVAINEESRDLLVQQFAGSPLFITTFLQAARERNAKLTSYLECERLYVDELLGGHIQHHFAELLEEVSADAETRLALIHLLGEAAAGNEPVASFEAWRKRLHLDASELEDVLHRLHVQEFVNWDGATIEAGGGPQAWKDYLKVRYRLDVLSEPRALVVADALADSLKRAPHTMARHYKQIAGLSLLELLSRFDCQRVPKTLFSYAQFSRSYKGEADEGIASGLESETDTFKLPQIVHVASCAAFSADMRRVCDEGRCLVAHGFDEASYTDEQEVVWLVSEVEAKLEVEADTVQTWCDRLERLAVTSGFRRYQIWLISNEGFSQEASELIIRRGAFASSRQQVRLLATHLGDERLSPVVSPEDGDEFLMVLPMGEENELVAANTVEQIARRLNFRPEAINQIKTSVVEACINASEHSFSPDRKIYQRFRVESDRLVITISSRGIVPTNIGSQEGTNSGAFESNDASEERRGWGLKLIRTLMDEVEFERVDEGTSLRMTKYVRHSSS
jgi:serine/threonine-protein kinase RsbW